MKVALYYRHLDEQHHESFHTLVNILHTAGIDTCEVNDGKQLADCDFLFSIGGDGTLLSAMQFISTLHSPLPTLHSPLPPILGINFGHLGFLTTVGKENLHSMVDELLRGDYTLEERTLLQLTHSSNQAVKQSSSQSFTLNEVFVHRTEEASLLRTQVYADDQYVATYAGDGVIVATPTGSTAYSLSCGGPILTPDSRCLLITPISAHTLTLRPVILPDTTKIRLHVEDDCFLGTDSRRTSLSGGNDITLNRAPFSIRLVRLGEQSFFSAIRDKLMWGTEIRHQ